MSKYGVFSGPYFPVFGLSSTGKYGPEKNSVFGRFSHSGPFQRSHYSREIFYFINSNISFFLGDHNGNKAMYFTAIPVAVVVFIYFTISFCIFLIWWRDEPTYFLVFKTVKFHIPRNKRLWQFIFKITV